MEKSVNGLNLVSPPKLPISKITTRYNLTGLWRQKPPPKFIPKTSPCKNGCPLNQNIPEALELIKQGKNKEAWRLWIQNNPLPSVCGRVCRHFCEEKCSRNDYDGAVKIGNIERFIGDSGLENNWSFDFPPNSGSKKRIAVIGSGPAGLAAVYFLRKAGMKIDFFEKEKNPGGVGRLIPGYRLPSGILTEETKKIIAAQEFNEIKFINQASLDESFIKNVLKNNFYGAAIIATGANEKKPLNIPGENSKMVLNALNFLAEEKPESAPKKILIIGGGNTAIDAGRTARRIYPRAEIKIVCPENRNKMPAYKTETDAALLEDIEIKNCLLPLQIKESDDCLEIKFCEVEFETDANGEIMFLPTDSYCFEETEIILTAVGSKVKIPFLETLNEEEKEKIFIIGDSSDNFGSISKAMASGKNAVARLLNFLETGEKQNNKESSLAVADIAFINLDYFWKKPPCRDKRLYLNSHKLKKEIANNFSELTETWSEYILEQEIERCFSCGVCVSCDNCVLFCPDLAVIKTSAQEEVYEIDKNYCKGCGICVKECPRGVLELGFRV